jgi:hypothetical protein
LALERLQFHTLALEPCVQIVISDRVLDLGRIERSHGRERDGWLTRETPLGDEEAASPREIDQLRAVRQAVGWLEASLARHGVPFRYGSEWELDGIIGSAPWTVVPTTEVVSDELAETLSYARRRGLPCSVGPFLPEGHVEATSGGGWPRSLGATESAVEAQVRELLLDAQLPQREISPNVARALCHVRIDEGRSTPAALFVLNPSSLDIEVSVACPGSLARDALTQVQIPSFAERLLVPVPAESIRMLELFPSEGPRDDRY